MRFARVVRLSGQTAPILPDACPGLPRPLGTPQNTGCKYSISDRIHCPQEQHSRRQHDPFHSQRRHCTSTPVPTAAERCQTLGVAISRDTGAAAGRRHEGSCRTRHRHDGTALARALKSSSAGSAPIGRSFAPGAAWPSTCLPEPACCAPCWPLDSSRALALHS
jgi:hypothetical protein